ncbi:hypothetical protein PHYC_01892 [Phycisphaerales bacterium]|nr:hypothetical protein PHYC_01892 [Phycisphaerales bacterium]
MTQSAAESPVDPSHSAFASEVEAALARLRLAAGELIHASQLQIERATDLQRALGVGPAIAWQLYRLATVESSFAALAFTPRVGSMDRLLRAAREHGFRVSAVEGMSKVYEEFSRLVSYHAGDRDTFDAMVAPLGNGTTGQIELKHRRAAFRGNVQVWGYQASTVYRACVCHPSTKPGHEAAAFVAGFVAIRQLRPTNPIPILRRKVFIERHGQVSEFDVSAQGPALIEEFSTATPSSIMAVGDGKHVRETLTLEGVGRAASVTCFLTDTVWDGPPRTADTPWSMGLMVSVPCETLIIDLLVPRGASQSAGVRVRTFGNPSNVDSAMTQSDEYLVPTRETGSYLGTSLDALQAAEVARCPSLVRHVLRRNGWEGAEFDLYRCRVRYPILHTAVSLDVPVKA